MEQTFKIEGRNPVIEAIKNDREIDQILISNSRNTFMTLPQALKGLVVIAMARCKKKVLVGVA